MKKLLITCHCPSPNTVTLRDAMVRGASHPDLSEVELRVTEPLQTSADDVLWCDGILLGTTENFGYMSGAMKDFFDRCYYPCLEHTQGKPYAIAIRAGNDGRGTQAAMEKIITGLRWNAIQEPIICRGEFQDDFIEQWEALGMTMAAGLEAGIY